MTINWLSALCTSLLLQEVLANCRDGDVMLLGGSSYLEGRVDVCYGGAWGTVCDDSWDDSEANVVCRQLGYSATGAVGFSNAKFGQGTGTIFLHDLNCNGSESSLFGCPSMSDCSHSEDAGVRCQDGDVALVFGGQRLVNNSLLSLELFNTSSPPLSCVSTFPSCCDTLRAGNWFLPDASTPVGVATGNESIYHSRDDNQTVSLHVRSGTGTVPEGLYRCEVPDVDNVTQTLYVGIYANNSRGAVSISSLEYRSSAQTLVCTSSGGPATFITWTKEGVPLEVGGVGSYSMSQVIVDSVGSVYENRLELLGKRSSHSGKYVCEVGNAEGRVNSSLSLEVCRDGETRLIIGQDQVTSSVEVCEGDRWQSSLATPLHILTTDLAPRNVQVTTNTNGFMLSWEHPPPSTSSDIISHEVNCTEQESGLTIIMVVSGTDTSVKFPVRLESSPALQCCVSAVMKKSSSIGALIAQTCMAGISGISGMGPPSGSSQTLAFVMGGVAAALFLTLVVVAALLVGLILLHARSKKGDSVEELEMNSGENVVANTNLKNTVNPIYDSVEPGLNQHMANIEETTPPSMPPRPNVHNPMYTSVEDLQFRRTSMSISSHVSPARDAIMRRNSTSAVMGRRVTSTEAPPPSTHNYSMIVPKHLRRKKSSSPPEGDEEESTVPGLPTDKESEPEEGVEEMYSKLQH